MLQCKVMSESKQNTAEIRVKLLRQLFQSKAFAINQYSHLTHNNFFRNVRRVDEHTNALELVELECLKPLGNLAHHLRLILINLK